MNDSTMNEDDKILKKIDDYITKGERFSEIFDNITQESVKHMSDVEREILMLRLLEFEELADDVDTFIEDESFDSLDS